MAILKRILRIIRFLVLLSIALVVGVIAVLTLTQKGRENLAGLISSMASSPGSSVRIVGLSGIWSGPLKIDNLVLEDSDGAWLAARGIAIDWSPLSLLSSTFEASLVHADRVELARLPKAGAKSSEGGGLPVSLDVDRIDLPEIALGGALAGEVAQVSAEGSLEANADPLTVKTDLKLLRSDGKAGALDAKIDFAPAEDRLAVDIHGSEPAGGIIANFLKLPGAPPVEIAMSGTGPAADWKVSGTFSVDGEVVTKISGTRQSTDKGNRIEAKGEGVFERFVPKTFRPLLAGQATFDFAGILTKQGGVIIGRANLESSALTATAKGVIDPSAASDFSMELAARGAPATLTFGEGDAAVTAAISKASLRAFGAGDAPTIDAAASLAKVTTATAELNGVEATLHSDGFDIANRSGPVTLSATAESAGSADPTIASLLAGALKADATATISGDGVHLDKAALSGDALSAAVQGDVSLTDGSLKLAVEADLLAALLPEAARAALAEKVNVVATVSRDAAGVVTVDPFTAKSGGLDASGTIALAADTLGVELTGNLADVSKLAPEIAGAIGFQISANGARTAPDVSASVSSDKLTAAGREITSLELSANGKADMANPAATVSIKGEVAGEALSGEAVLKTSDGIRRIDGLSLTLGANTITGDLGLDPAFVPEGALAFTLPDIAPLAALAFERAAGEVKGSVRFGSTDGVPQLSIDADIASIVRGDLSVKGASVTALVKDYLVAPAVSGQVHAPLVTSGSTSVSDVDVALTRDGDWTGFSGGVTVNDIVAKAAGRAKIAPGATTIELASGTATTRGISAELAGASTLVIKGGETALDKLRLGVSGGTVEVTGTVGKALNLDIQIGALPASIVTAFAPALSATGTLSGSARISRAIGTATDSSAANDLALELAADGAPATLAFGEGDAAVTVAISKASLRAFGAGDAPTIDAAASLAKVTTATAEASGIEAKLHSDGFNIANRSGPVTLSATAESAGSADETIAGLLAGALKADITAAISRDSIHFDKATLSDDALSASVAGDVSLTDGSLTLAVEADLLAALLPEAARAALADKVSVVATVSRDAAGAIRVDPLTAKSGGLDATGSVALAADTIGVELKGGLADISKLAPDTEGAIGFQISASGARSAPDISATISSDKFTAAGREITGLQFSAKGKADMANPAATVSITGNVAGEALAGAAVLKTANGQRRIDGLSLTLGANTITGDLALDQAFVPEGALAFTLPDIGPLAALAFDKAAGEVKGTISFSKIGTVPQLTLDARSASIARGDLSVKSAEVTASVQNYLVTPAISGKVRALSVVSGSTSVSDVDVALTRDGDWTGFSGGATVNDIVARAAGRAKIAQGATTIELASGTATTRGVTAKLARATTVLIKGGETTLDRLALGVGGGSVQVTGTAGQALNLDIQISALPATVVNAFAPGLGAVGAISGTARISGAAAKPDIGYTLQWENAQTTQTRSAGFGAMSINSSGTLAAGALEFTANVGDGSGLGMKGGGTVDTGRRTLSLDFSGGVPFSFLTKRLAAQGLSLSGTSNVSLALRGSIGAPVVSGKVTASGARLVDARSGLAVNGIAADVAVAGGVATVRLNGTLSSGGALSASGTVGIDAAKGFPANLAVKIADARYTDGRIVTANLSGDVALKGQLTQQPLLSGTINLAKTVITIPERLPGSLTTLGVKHKNAPAAVREQEEAIRPAAAGSGGGSGLNLDLTVNAPQQIFVRGRGLDAELGGSIRLTGPLASPRAIGQFTLRRGRLAILGKRLAFTRGTLGFSGSLIPTLDLAAESTASGATVTIDVIGLATNPKFNFSSSPSLPQDEVLARLVFGRSMSNLSPLQIAQLADAAAQLAGGGGSTSLLETLRGKVGIDDLDVKTDSEGKAAVSAGKYLNDRTYVTIEKGEKASSGKATIDLDVGRGVKLRGEANESGDTKGGIFYEREY